MNICDIVLEEVFEEVPEYCLLIFKGTSEDYLLLIEGGLSLRIRCVDDDEMQYGLYEGDKEIKKGVIYI